MRHRLSIPLLAALVVAGLLGLAFVERRRLLVYALALSGPPPLLAAAEEGPGARWHDDYFTVQALDEDTFAIGEPRYAQQNFSYLIVGSERAVLFDAGPGVRAIETVARSLTAKPITFVPSHFHYDHLGDGARYDGVAVVDLPYLRERTPDERLQLRFGEHLGVAEGIAAPVLEIDEWLAPGSEIALGGRSLRVLYTPGHTEDSISLLDASRGTVFSGDFIYPGPLYAFLPNSGMGDYALGAQTILRATAGTERVYGAHRVAPPGAPELAISDVEDLQRALQQIRAGALEGEGVYPVSYPVNERMQLLAEPGWLQRWEPRRAAGRD